MSRASDQAYKIIKDQILSGSLPPRSQLKEEELAELCGVSRTPVRDALRRLEAEMLVRRSDTQRTFVPDWSSEEVEDIFTLRALIESHAAVRSATRITNEEIDQLKAFNARLREVIADPRGFDHDSFVHYNREFHNAILEASRSERLIRMRSLLVEQVIQHRTARSYDPAGLIRSHADHEELVLAFEARDPDWARSLMNSHILRALHVTLQERAEDGLIVKLAPNSIAA